MSFKTLVNYLKLKRVFNTLYKLDKKQNVCVVVNERYRVGYSKKKEDKSDEFKTQLYMYVSTNVESSGI